MAWYALVPMVRAWGQSPTEQAAVLKSLVARSLDHEGGGADWQGLVRYGPSCRWQVER